MNILILEDNKSQIKSLKRMIYEVDKNLDVYEAQGKNEALDICKRINIDIFFVDIILKNSSGLDFVLELRKIHKYEFSWVVFLTGHVEYIIQAFKKTHCYDYILKPYDKNEIIEITEKLVSQTINKRNTSDQKKFLVFEIKNNISVKLYNDEIIFIEVMLRTCMIHTKKGIYKTNKLSLKKTLNLLDCNYIVQSHKSFAVNIKHIKAIKSIDSKLSSIHFENYQEKAYLGYKYKKILMEKFKNSQ